jgi:hypothetical protein
MTHHGSESEQREPVPSLSDRRETHRPYVGLTLSLAGSFVAMYFAMYAMADRLEHVYLNLSNVWMTGFMTAAMSVPMFLAMGHMFPTARAKVVAWATVVVLGVASWFLLRAEAGVGDRQFLRAMIPHHSAAIQMVRESDFADPRVKKLAEQIISSQEREIAEMKALLNESK